MAVSRGCGRPGPDEWLEHRLQALWSHQCARLRVHARSGRRRVEVASPAVPVAAGAVTTGRVHPLERAAAAAQQRGQRSEDFADSYDALLVGVEAEVAAPVAACVSGFAVAVGWIESPGTLACACCMWLCAMGQHR